MDEIDRHEFLSEAIALLDERETQAEPHYWIVDGDDSDEYEDYCFDCVVKVMPQIWAEPHEHYRYGHWDESDCCVLCEECGKLLKYTLTDYGVANELEHFVEYGFDWNNPNECAELARVAHGIYKNEEQWAKLFEVVTKGENFPDQLQAILAEITS